MSATICTLERFRTLQVSKAIRQSAPHAPKLIVEMAVNEGIRALDATGQPYYAIKRGKNVLRGARALQGGDAA